MAIKKIDMTEEAVDDPTLPPEVIPPEAIPPEVIPPEAIPPEVIPPVKVYLTIVRKQANRLLRLFELPPEHEGRNERIAEYQEALKRNCVDNPPVDIQTTHEFIREVGEYNG